MARRYDADFELENLTFEAEEIFKEFYCNFLAGNKDFLDLVCGDAVLPLCKAWIDIRTKEGWKYKFEEFLDCGFAQFQGAKIEEGKPHFTYHFEVQEFDAKVSLKDGSDTDSETLKTKGLVSSTYRIALSLHPEPAVDITGHYWQIVEFGKIQEVKQLV